MPSSASGKTIIPPDQHILTVQEALEPLYQRLEQEVETKLDLARAYIVVGDKEGAREILEEVLSEGDKGQKANAEKLLAEAG